METPSSTFTFLSPHITYANAPSEILVHIWKYLSVTERLVVSQVSNHWGVSVLHASLWQRCKLFVRKDRIIEFCNFFKKAPFIKQLDLKYSSIKSPGQICNCVSDYHHITPVTADEGVALNEVMAALDQLTCLTLHITYRMTKFPPSLKHLNLKVHQDVIDDDLLAIASHSPLLNSLILSSAAKPNFTDIGVKEILKAKKKNLSNFSLKCESLNLQNLGGGLLRKCKNITSLSLYECPTITKALLIDLSSLNNLTTIHLDVHSECIHLLVQACTVNKYMPLKNLWLICQYDFLDDEFFDALSKAMPNLVTFALSQTDFQEEALVKCVKLLPMLKNIFIKSCPNDVNWKLMKLLQEVMKKKPFDRICLCGIRNFESLPEEREEMEALKKDGFPCDNCELTSFLFACDCML